MTRRQSVAALLAVLALTFGVRDSNAQLIALDNFDWTVERFKLKAENGGTPNLIDFTRSNALGGETDIVMTMPVMVDSTSRMKLKVDGSVAHFTSTAGTTGQWLISYDGVDFAGDTVRASAGLNGFDLTFGGAIDRFTFRVQYDGLPLNVAMVVASDTNALSEFQLPIIATDDTVMVDMPFGSFTSGADFTSVNAILLFVGAGGGALGPVDLRLMDFGFGSTPYTPVVTDTFLYNQTNGPDGQPWYTNDFGPGVPFNAEAADDFTVSASADWRVSGLRLRGTYISGPAPNPTANLNIVRDAGGPYGDTLVAYPNLPVSSWNPFVLNLGDTLGLGEGTYWFRVTLNSPPGTEGFFRGTPATFGSPALWRNPANGFGFGCTSFTPLNQCNSDDRSFLFEVVGRKEAPVADIEVVTTVDDDRVLVGDTLEFTTTVTNVGNVASAETEIRVFYGQVTVLNHSTSQGTCGEINVTELNDYVTCTLGLLAPGESATIHATTVNDSRGTGRTSAEFRPGAFPDAVAENNVGFVKHIVESAVTVSKEASGSEFLVGSTITFDVTVKNVSSETVTGVRVEDSFDNDGFTYLSDTGGCTDPVPGEYSNSALRCDIGTLEPMEERTFTMEMRARGASGFSGNRAAVFSSGGFEDRDVVRVQLSGEFGLPALYFWVGVIPDEFQKRSVAGIDVYLNDFLLADDILPGQARPYQSIKVSEYPYFLYFAPGSSSDRSESVDSVEVELGGATPGHGIALIHVTGPDGLNDVVEIRRVKLDADDPNGARFSFVHAATAVPTVSALIAGDELTPSPLGSLAYGESTEFFPWETVPAIFNLHVTPEVDAAAEEVYNVDLSTPGLSYLLVLAPDSSVGKLESTNLYVVDSEGQTAVSAIVTSFESGIEVPARYALHANYPNPFNPTTRIEYDVPTASDVNLAVYDVSGRQVRTLVDAWHMAGTHSITWSGASDSGSTLASGVYFYRMSSGSFVASRKMLLVK